MATIVTRAGKGAPLTNAEVDANFNNLNSDKVETSTISTFGASLIDDADASAARTTLGLGSAATTDSTAYATAAQGGTADSALQPGDAVPQTAATGSAIIPAGDESERDGSPAAGYFRFNTDTASFEGYNGTEWGSVGGGGGGGGGGVELTASGAISAGDPVGLNADGTVSTLDPSWLVPSFPEGASSVVYDTANDKIVIAYRQGTTAGRVIIGTVSGHTVTYGSSVNFRTGDVNGASIRVAFDSANSRVVIAYRDTANSNFGTAIVGTVSGTSISFGTPVVFFSTTMTTTDIQIAFDSTNNKVVISWSTATNSQAIVGTVSGTSISFGTAVTMVAAASTQVGMTFDSANGRIVAAYFTSGTGTSFVVGTVSGTSISFGTPVLVTGFLTTTNTVGRPVYDSVSGKVVVYGVTSSGSTYDFYFQPLSFAQGTVSGTSISFGSLTEMPGEYRVAAANNVLLVPNQSTGSMTLHFIDQAYSSNLYRQVLRVVRVSGSSFTFDEPVIIRDMIQGTTGAIGAFDPDSGVAVVIISDGNLGGTLITYLFAPDGNFFKYVGFAAASISSGATGVINVPGQINESQTGLTVGARYFLDEDGELSTSPFFSHNREAGLAVSATKLLLTNPRIRAT